jgi:hypothetical protein
VPHTDKPEPVDAEAKRESLSYGGRIDALPPAFFLAVHLIGFLLGAFFAYRAFEGTAHLMGWGFSLHVLADLVYMPTTWTGQLSCLPTPFRRSLTWSPSCCCLWRQHKVSDCDSRVAKWPQCRRRGDVCAARAQRGASHTGLVAGRGQTAGRPVRTDQVNPRPSYRFERAVIQVGRPYLGYLDHNDHFAQSFKVRDGADHVIRPGENVSIPFNSAGEYPYICTYPCSGHEGEGRRRCASTLAPHAPLLSHVGGQRLCMHI